MYVVIEMGLSDAFEGSTVFSGTNRRLIGMISRLLLPIVNGLPQARNAALPRRELETRSESEMP
jgi:hypothetical protein